MIIVVYFCTLYSSPFLADSLYLVQETTFSPLHPTTKRHDEEYENLACGIPI
jgi:hypothetical protein